VGKPLEVLLSARGANVSICNDQTKKLPDVSKQADILISATGVPKLIDEKFVSKEAIVIDIGSGVGADGKISGDVDFDAVKNIASAISPVPGGVGPMTVVSLFENLINTTPRY